MKYLYLAGLLACLFVGELNAKPALEMHYTIDVTQQLDTFYIRLDVEGRLAPSDTLFQFAATAPGTYQTMNIGRLVSAFIAYDKKGRQLTVSQPTVNQFVIDQPQKVHHITYQVAETFDTTLPEFPIYPMCGSSIEEDHALINAHTMMGYFSQHQNVVFYVRLKGQPGWLTGTALAQSGDEFKAVSFDELVDSPILSGVLTRADTTIAQTQVEIYTYAKSGVITSQLLLSDMSDMLDASRQFLINLPVDRYAFLYHFEPPVEGKRSGGGAWEHSYSSEYVLTERAPTAEFLAGVTDIASHEFFHIVTPLNIHSEVIETFNYVQPTPSMHLWMYEGVTEWASNILMYRAGLLPDSVFFDEALAYKAGVATYYFDSAWSLQRISEESFNGGEGARQYGNVYYRGALVAGMLDILLLDMSDGQAGLRELLLDLIEAYGKGKPVSEANFFDELVSRTYPEVRPFIDAYILGNTPIPFNEYFNRIGLEMTQPTKDSFQVSRMEELTPRQKQLFTAWSTNLKR